MRLFIALSLSPGFKKAAGALVARQKNAISGVKWVKESAMHLTLKFLGEVDAGDCGKIKEAIAASLDSFSPFELGLRGVGVFPSPSGARVLWAGVSPGAEESAAMAAALDQGLTPLGFKAEKRKFSAHLTLGRLRYPVPEGAIRHFLEGEKDFQTGTSLIEEVVLYVSDLTPRGAIYTPLYSNRL